MAVAGVDDVDPSGGLLDRLGRNEAETRRLSRSVQGLTAAISDTADLRRQQLETAQRVDDAAVLAADTKSEALARTTRLWRAGIAAAAGVVLLMLLINVLMFAGLTNYVVDLLEQQRADRMAACEKRNEATLSNIRREVALATADPVAAVEKIHRDSARELTKGIVDCDKSTRVTR